MKFVVENIFNLRLNVSICKLRRKLERICFIIQYIFLFFILAFDFCWFCMVIRFFHPCHNGQWPPTSQDFLYQILSITFISYLNSWERASISALKKGTTGTIFVTSLVWRGPWLGIEPGTSRTRSQHYTTKLSRRR